jgi:hypothetical protein
VAVISPIVHMVVETFGATLKHLRWRRMQPSMKGEDTLNRRCEGHNMSPSSDYRMTTSGDTSDRRCEGHNMSPSSDHPITTGKDTLEKMWGLWKEPSSECPKADVMARYEWTGVWIANEVAIMSMNTNAELTFMPLG